MESAVDNIILCADSYKVSHYKLYPPKTTKIYSYFESRGGKYNEIVFFGLQYIIKKWLVGVVVTKEKVLEAKQIFKDHFGADIYNEEGWMYIIKQHQGRLPIRIKAVPEGTVLPTRNVLFTVENTDPKCYWLTNYLETVLVQVWYPMTVSTNSHHFKKIIKQYDQETMDIDCENFLNIQLHDFGYRGSTTVESASIGGLAHLVIFRGTDNISSLLAARKYYSETSAGFSVPAAEHSTIISWGQDKEADAYKHALNAYPTMTVSVVSDSYDIFNAVQTIWGKQLKSFVCERALKGGKLVIRPDSGDPTTNLVKVLKILGETFGSTTNTKGFKVLPPYLRVIQGDGVNLEELKKMLQALKDNRWSTENVVFGSGGTLLQKLDRDTLKCAFKCSFSVVDGVEKNVFKNPKTDPNKKSKKGQLKLLKVDGTFKTVEECNGDFSGDNLQLVFENGALMKEWTLEEIRQKCKL